MSDRVLFERLIGDCFHLTIPLLNPEVEIQKAVQDAMEIEKATKAMLQGSISPDELLEWMEPYTQAPMDAYVQEVKENLTFYGLYD